MNAEVKFRLLPSMCPDGGQLCSAQVSAFLVCRPWWQLGLSKQMPFDILTIIYLFGGAGLMMCHARTRHAKNDLPGCLMEIAGA
jgi:hypothetical protein